MARAAQAELGASIRGGLVVGPVPVSVDPPLVFVQGEHRLRENAANRTFGSPVKVKLGSLAR